MSTVTYYITAPDAGEALRVGWDAEARGLGGPEVAERREDVPALLRKGHIWRVRIPAQRPDGRVSLLGIAEDVAE